MPWPRDLLVDVAGQQPGGQPGVLRLLADQLGGGLDRQPVQLGGGGAVVEAADRAGGDAQRVDVDQVVAHRSTARTILLTSTGSVSPLRLRTCIGGAAAGRRSSRSSRRSRLVSVVMLLSPRELAGGRGTRGGDDDGRQAQASSRAVGRPTREASDHRARSVRGALAGLRTRGHRPDSMPVDPYWPSLPRPVVTGPVLCDGGRSHSPLRGSPGFAPGSLLPRPRLADAGRTSCATTICRSGDQVRDHMLCRRVGPPRPLGGGPEHDVLARDRGAEPGVVADQRDVGGRGWRRR